MGASQTYANGNKVVWGQQGEVTGPGDGQKYKGKGVQVIFPGNTGVVSCFLNTVRRFRAASTLPLPHASHRARLCTATHAKLSPPPPPHTHATLPTPPAFPRQPSSAAAPQPALHEQPLAPQPTHMDAGGMVAEGVVRAGRFGEPRCAAAAAGRVQGGREGVLHGGELDLTERQQGRARPAGRGDGARHWPELQGQGRGGALPRQQGQLGMLPRHGPPPPRRLRCHPSPAPHTRDAAHTRPLRYVPRRPLPLCRGAPAHTACAA
eukprot:scaffold99297_cov60-Phaeocystis_antarctica.AAC.4